MYDGILPIWKDFGMTSHDVIFRLRKILHMKKIGHTGTLDPDVEGVLLICLGKATKLVEFLMDGEKVYEGGICLGISTETEDASGKIIQKKPVNPSLSQDIVDQAMVSMQGQITQIPPYYSAVKVEGKKLYEYARQGISVNRPSREVMIHQFKRTSPIDYDSNNDTYHWDFYVACSKGTYVRTLAVDLGEVLGYPAHMTHLKRTATGGFTNDQAFSLEEIQNFMDNRRLSDKIYSIDDVELDMDSIEINHRQYEEIRYGKLLPKDYFGLDIDTFLAVYYLGHLIGIYQPHPEKHAYIKPKKMIM